MLNVDINVDRQTDRWMDGRTENRMPISHPATSRCDKNDLKGYTFRESNSVKIILPLFRKWVYSKRKTRAVSRQHRLPGIGVILECQGTL